jgi:hypothetical protein
LAGTPGLIFLSAPADQTMIGELKDGKINEWFWDFFGEMF